MGSDAGFERSNAIPAKGLCTFVTLQKGNAHKVMKMMLIVTCV